MRQAHPPHLATLTLAAVIAATPAALAQQDQVPVTAPRVEDKATVPPIPLTPGADGAAPSEALTEEGMGRPVGTADTAGPAAEAADMPEPDTAAAYRIGKAMADRLVGTRVITNDGSAAGQIIEVLPPAEGSTLDRVVIDTLPDSGNGRVIEVPAASLDIYPEGIGDDDQVMLQMSSGELDILPARE